jgi:hypothetical protein
MRHSRWLRRLRRLALPACGLALALPASAPAAPHQDLRSPDTRDAASAASQAEEEAITPRPTTVIESRDSDDLAIVLASAAIGIALAGLTVALCALFRRPRARWTVG